MRIIFTRTDPLDGKKVYYRILKPEDIEEFYSKGTPTTNKYMVSRGQGNDPIYAVDMPDGALIFSKDDKIFISEGYDYFHTTSKWFPDGGNGFLLSLTV